MSKNKNKKDDDGPVVSRLGAETRMLIHRHGTVQSGKGYRRKGRSFQQFMKKELADQEQLTGQPIED